MRETLKVLCLVVLMFGVPTAAVTWIDPHPTTTVTLLKFSCPVLAVLGLAGFLLLHFRADKVPDYLSREFPNFFNRGGFCFAFRPTLEEGVCWLEVYFQNQQDKPCIGQVALRPARGFFLGRVKMDPIAVQIPCEPAAYGIAKVPIPIPWDLQEKKQSFEVGASVEYPNGKGSTLRFRDGISLRANSNFGNAFGTLLIAGGVMTGHLGHILFLRPKTVTLELPGGAYEEVPDGLKPEILTRWKLGDSPLQELS